MADHRQPGSPACRHCSALGWWNQCGACTYNIIPEKVSVVAGIRICSEDFAWYQIRIPGALMFLGVGNEAKGTNYAQHHAKFNTADDAIALGVTGLVAIAWDFLLNKK